MTPEELDQLEKWLESPIVGTHRDMKRLVAMSRAALKMREALESISGIHCEGHETMATMQHWLNAEHEECAAVLAHDTGLARAVLEETKECFG
jgi:sirohydrochlorin ferrochelatase